MELAELLAGNEGDLQGLFGRPGLLDGRIRTQSADEQVPGLVNLAGNLFDAFIVKQSPVFALLVDAGQAAADKLKQEVVGLVAIHEAAGFTENGPATGNWPKDGQARRPIGPLRADNLRVSKLELGAQRHPVTANEVSAGKIHVADWPTIVVHLES